MAEGLILLLGVLNVLDDYYKIYRERAKQVKGWDKIDKNKLINDCVDCDDSTLKDCYVAAIVCRYWPALCSSYQQSFMAASEEDVYDWFISSILYVLRNRAWRNPASSLYGDEKGPDKCINIKIKCSRLTFFQQNNRYNRKINHGVESIDKLTEELGDACAPSTVDQISDNSAFYAWIRKEYLAMNYLNALALDLIISSDVFNDYKTDPMQSFNIQKLIKQIKSIDDVYFKYFSEEYEFPLGEVQNNFIRYKAVPKKVLQENIEFFFQTLGRV